MVFTAHELIQTGVGEAALKRQWEVVPRAVVDHIGESSDIKRESVIMREIGLTGAYEAVRTMVWADYAEGMCRSGYEMWQGMDDFGFFDMGKPGWERPGFYRIERDGRKIRYDGRMSFVEAGIIEARNCGVLDRGNILNLSNDTSVFDAMGGVLQNGGFGQGLKVADTCVVANKTDRINALILHRDNAKSGLSDGDKARINEAIGELEQSLEAEGENETFVTIQAMDREGKYYRVYGFREDFIQGDKKLWKLKFIECDLDESLVDKNDLGKVVIQIHNPDSMLGKVFDGLSNNLLSLDPRSAVERKMVDSDFRGIAPFTDFDFLNSPISGLRGRYSLRMIDDNGRSGIFFRGMSVKPKEDPEMKTIFMWDVARVDSTAVGYVNRTSNSVGVTGPIGEMIGLAVSQIAVPVYWERILTKFKEVCEAGGGNLSDYPELNPIVGSESEFRGEVIKGAFEKLFPKSGSWFALSEGGLRDWKMFAPTSSEMEVPVFAKGKMTELLVRVGYKSVEDDLISRFHLRYGFNSSYSMSMQVIEEGRAGDVSSRVEGGAVGKIIFDAFTGDDMGFVSEGAFYGVGATGGVGLDFVFNAGDLGLWDPLVFGYRGRVKFASACVKLAMKVWSWGGELVLERFNGYGGSQLEVVERTSDGKCVIIRGTGERSNPEMKGKTVVHLRGGLSDLRNVQSMLDEHFRQARPELLANRPGSDLGDMITSLGYMVDKGSESGKLQDVTAEVVGRLKKEREGLEQQKQRLKGELKKKLAADPDVNAASATGWVGGEDGMRVVDVMDEGSFLGRSSASWRVESVPRTRLFETEKSGGVEGVRSKERLVFKVGEYRVTWYGRNYPDLYPLEAYEAIGVREDGLVVSNLVNDLELAEDDEHPVWRRYDPKRGSGYIVQKKDGATLYEGMFEFEQELIPARGAETVLPVDARGFQVMFIQVPVSTDADPDVPMLMYDRINQQYSIVFNDDEGALKTLPKGTRIYVKERSRSFVPDEEILRSKYPDYYHLLTESITRTDRLDDEAREFLIYIRDRVPVLSREQKVAAVYDFWERRRLYDNEGIQAEGIEKLISSGVGQCKEAAVAELDMIRLEGVPARLRAAYPDNRRSGLLTPPLHAVIEFLDDNGDWRVHDPPNSKVTTEYAGRVADAVVAGTNPTIHDAVSLARNTSAPSVDLPADVKAVMGKVEDRKGARMKSVFGAAVKILRGENMTVGDRVTMTDQVAAALVGTETETKASASSQALVGDQAEQVVKRIRESMARWDKLREEYKLDAKKLSELKSLMVWELTRRLAAMFTTDL